MKTIFMGTPWFSVPTLERLLSGGYSVSAVYTQPDREAGRGRSVIASAVKKFALENGLTIEQPANFKDPAVIETLKAYEPDTIVVFSYGQILPQAVLDIPRLGCLNVHPSLLPKYRGAAPVISALLGGDEFTGVTVMMMAKKLDSGDILVQSQVPVLDYDTAGILTAKLSLIASQMVPDVLPRLETGELVPRPQDNALATYSGQLAKQDGIIDWSLPALTIWRRIRAFNPWPGCSTTWNGKNLKIDSAQPLEGIPGVKPGQVLEIAGMVGIGTGEGTLGVTKLQLEGKKLMSAGDFLRGQGAIVGAVLPS